MKRWLLAGFLLSSTQVFAVNPVQGFYGGLLAQVSHSSNIKNYNFVNPLNNVLLTGELNYNLAGGGGGGAIGYRIQKFRVEAEGLYNRIAYNELKIGGCTIGSPTVSTQVSSACQSGGANLGFNGYNGSTSVIYGLINAYYDFITYGEDSSLMPYIGLGLGAARINNSASLYESSNALSKNLGGYTKISNSAAAQGIIGLGYFIDDYVWAGLDYRYLSSNSVPEFDDTRYAISTITININFSFDTT